MTPVLQETSPTATHLPMEKPDLEDPICQANERYKTALNSLISLIAQGDNDSVSKLLAFLRTQDTIYDAMQEVLQLRFLPE